MTLGTIYIDVTTTDVPHDTDPTDLHDYHVSTLTTWLRGAAAMTVPSNALSDYLPGGCATYPVGTTGTVTRLASDPVNGAVGIARRLNTYFRINGWSDVLARVAVVTAAGETIDVAGTYPLDFADFANAHA